jgi:hypothetical protein
MSHLDVDDSDISTGFVEFIDEYNLIENNMPMSLKRKLKLADEVVVDDAPLTTLEMCFVEEE